MKHFYLHTSNLDLIREIEVDGVFDNVWEYPKVQFAKAHQNEIGTIKTGLNNYHIITGGVPQEGCPWCGHPVELKQIYPPNSFNRDIAGFDKYFMECTNCYSRGPIMNVCQQVIHREDDMNKIKDMISQRYKFRRQWDADFKNPYEIGS